MHPILFRIPLPHMPLKIWWGLAIIALVSLVYTALAVRARDKGGLVGSLLFLVGSCVCAYVFRAKTFEAPNLPIYSYGVMLGLSLVIGWYLTLTLAARDGLPKETMANCYVITALAAIVGARLLYVATNLDEFKTLADVFALRRGGLVAYGGFLGGFLGSWAYLSSFGIRLMPWADVAVPSLASGLCVTRIGCYLFGCDFGKPLPENAPHFLQKLGTFPHWSAGTLDAGEGSPAYIRHLELWPDKVRGLEASLPVHPTQIYESFVGFCLLAIVLLQRKTQRFRGQIFLTFVFAYGACRFLLELIRDDVERGEYGPSLPEHIVIPGALVFMALGFVFGISLGIRNAILRNALRVLAFVPAVVCYVVLKPVSFGTQLSVQLSTSQWIALGTVLLSSFYYAKMWDDAKKNPKLAMSLGHVGALAGGGEVDAEDESEDSDDPKRTIAETPDARRKADEG